MSPPGIPVTQKRAGWGMSSGPRGCAERVSGLEAQRLPRGRRVAGEGFFRAPTFVRDGAFGLGVARFVLDAGFVARVVVAGFRVGRFVFAVAWLCRAVLLGFEGVFAFAFARS